MKDGLRLKYRHTLELGGDIGQIDFVTVYAKGIANKPRVLTIRCLCALLY